MATATLPPPGSPVDLSGDPRRHRRERTMGIVFFAAAAMSLLISALILVSLFSNGLEFFTDVDWSRVFGSDSWAPRRDEFGITTILVGSLIVTGRGAMMAGGMGAGILSIPRGASASEGARWGAPNGLGGASAGVGPRRMS